jgi:hypothetical protein
MSLVIYHKRNNNKKAKQTYNMNRQNINYQNKINMNFYLQKVKLIK